MRHTIILLVVVGIFGFVSLSVAQKQLVEIKYDFVSYGGYQRTQTLLLKDGKSHFEFRKEDQQLENKDGMTFIHYFSQQDIYTDLVSGKMTFRKLHKDKKTPLISSWPLQKFDWQISSETKELLGYTVQKATTKSYYFEYGGELSQYSKGEVTAWFAPDLPFSAGPDGYYGLPGVVLELEYSRVRDHYIAKSVTIAPNYTSESLSIPTDGFNISKEQMIFPAKNPIDQKALKEYQTMKKKQKMG
jgi:GLPGLI family protein